MVPDADCTIGACGGKGVVGWVEGKRVDGPNVVDVVDGLSVALESVLFILRGGGWVEVFNSYSTFH